MPGEVWTRPSDEWQQLIVSLLSMKFPVGDFVPIPDKVGGDCGLEGFTRDGTAFQCYAAEEPVNSHDLTIKQKAKVTRDIGKLSQYKDTLIKILGPTVLKKWVLVVPRWDDKSLLSHAEEKLSAIRSQGIPFIDPSIVPGICTGDEFRTEREQLLRQGADSLRIAGRPVREADVGDWAQSNDALAGTLYEKTLVICRQDAAAARQLRDESIRHYLEGQNALAQLAERFPSLHEGVSQIKTDKENFLATESLTTSALPPDHFRSTCAELESDLRNNFKGLDPFTVRQLVQGAVADWLLRCPLQFPRTA